MPPLPRAVAMLSLLLLSPVAPAAADTPLTFGVISQRSPITTAQYWNPILRYVGQRSGIPLRLKLAKTGEEHAAMIGRGEFDFIYSNHNFTRENASRGYTVFLRPIATRIRGQIVVLADSPIRTLLELRGQEVAFPSSVAFVGYHVPMDALIRSGVQVERVFAGNQEGAMGQLTSKRVAAAGVNSVVMQDFASRHQLAYRVLWSSEEFLSIPISAHPMIPPETVRAVRDAFLAMNDDPVGRQVLADSANLVKQDPTYGFTVANDAEYDNVRNVYRRGIVQGK
jgi:phosphonate transport system substrate-binding protein